MEVQPIAGALGAEVGGVDLTRLPDSGWRDLHQALLRYSVLAIRGQELEPADLMKVGARFGEPSETVNFGGNRDGMKSLMGGLVGVNSDMSEEESRPIVDFLQAYQTRPEFTCRVRWSPGTPTVWDNRCTMHNAINDYHGQRRRMRRLTVGPQTPQ